MFIMFRECNGPLHLHYLSGPVLLSLTVLMIQRMRDIFLIEMIKTIMPLPYLRFNQSSGIGQ